MRIIQLLIILAASTMFNTLVLAEAVARDFDFLQMKRGGLLYQQYCAHCHGENAQGAGNWQMRDAAGRMPAPPLDGTGHAWHHPEKVLIDVIQNGTRRIGGNMPPWKDKLSKAQIHDVIAWFQSKWSDEIYAAWYRQEKHTEK